MQGKQKKSAGQQGQVSPVAGQPAGTPAKRPRTKEDAIREMVERDPQRAAQMIREILKSR